MLTRNFIPALRRRLAAYWWRRRYRNHLVIFNFHQVTPTFRPGEHASGTWTSLAQFSADIDYLASRFTILKLEEAWNRLRRGELAGACAAITFDDGDRSVAEYCVPLLEKQAIPATFFVNSAYFEGTGHYWFSTLNYLRQRSVLGMPGAAAADLDRKANELRVTTDPVRYAALKDEIARRGEEAGLPRRRCVSPTWLATLNEGLFAIGAHGHEHQRYSMMSADWQKRDLRLNVEFLRQFKCFTPMFAIPFGRRADYDGATLQAAAENGLAAWAAEGGINVAYQPVGMRIPADGRSLHAATIHEMLGSRCSARESNG